MLPAANLGLPDTVPAKAGAAGVPLRIASIPLLAELWNYWADKRGMRSMPRRSDIAPYEIPSLLPYLTIVERTADGGFRYRLVGTAVVAADGFDATGKRFDEAFAEPRSAIAIRHCGLVFERARPLLSSSNYLSLGGVPYRATRLLLPLTDDQMRVTVIVIGNAFALSIERPELLGDPTVALDAEEFWML